MDEPGQAFAPIGDDSHGYPQGLQTLQRREHIGVELPMCRIGIGLVDGFGQLRDLSS